MDVDAPSFISTCTLCSHSKASHWPPAGLLHLLPVPGHPCSCKALNYVTDLLLSQGNNYSQYCDLFSQSCALHMTFQIPYSPWSHQPPGLPHLPLSILSDIVSEQGPQFFSQVFYQALRASVSLSSGFHPQTNGQYLEAVLHCISPITLEHTTHLNWVCPQLPDQYCHWYVLFSMFSRLSTPFVSCP